VGGVERITLAADKGYDTKEFVKEMRGMNVTPHVSQNTKRQGGRRQPPPSGKAHGSTGTRWTTLRLSVLSQRAAAARMSSAVTTSNACGRSKRRSGAPK